MSQSNFDQVRRWVGDSEPWLRAFLKDAGKSPSIVSVVAIGSAVRNQGHSRSDFDLLILYRGRRPPIDPPLEVDVRMYEVESAEEKLAAGHEVLGWAVKFGIPLHDPDRAWEVLSSKYRARVPLPSAAQAAERAERSLSRARDMLDVGDEAAAEDLILAAITQSVREQLIKHGVFPASRPELPDQLRAICPHDPLPRLLEDAMYGDWLASALLKRLDAACERTRG